MNGQPDNAMANLPHVHTLSVSDVDGPAAAHFHRAVRLQNRHQTEEALACYRRAMELAPGMDEACHNMGVIYFEQKAWGQAISLFKKALDLNPGFAIAAFNLATSLRSCGHFEKAVLIYQLYLDLKPNQPEGHFGQGLCHMNLASPRRAVEAMRSAVALAPTNAAYWFHLAEANFAIGDMASVFSCYRKAIALRPRWVAAHYNLAVALRLAERIDEAMAHLKQAIHIDPNYAKPLPLLFRLAQHACDWRLADTVSSRLDQVTADELNRGVKTTEPPMTSIRRHGDTRRNMDIARSWSDHLYRRITNSPSLPPFDAPAADAHRIRVGYLSSDYKDHAVAHQIRGLFENHDRRRFEIFGYACNPDNGTPYRQKLAHACDHFRDVHADSNPAIARQIHADGIHILVDMSGHSRGNRLGIAAMRPAPVQVSYLGFLGTTGASFIDYALADTIVVPEKHARFYTEKMAYLPHCYQANDDKMSIAVQTYDRSHWHLPEHAFVYCSFNQPYKIDAGLFSIWMRILRNVEDSVLWLVERSPLARENLRQAAGNAGVDPDRLIFTGFVALEQNLARLQLADLALDTLIYNGGATTANALWAGLPVLTTLGGHWVSRMSASALNAVDLPELIALDREAYGRKAIELALDQTRMADIRRRLRRRRSNAPLFDTRGFTRDVEKAFTHMWHRHIRGLKPASFEVQP